MKQFFLIFSLSLMSASLVGMEQYLRKDLLEARRRWAGQESRVGQLKWEAEHIAQNKLVNYFNGTDYVADIDAKTKTIKTFIGSGSIILSYEQFSTFLRDQALYDESLGINK